MASQKISMTFLLIAFSLAKSAFALGSQTSSDSCTYNQKQMLAMDFLTFDQDTVNGGGWRSISAKKSCNLAAADLIKSYRQAHPELIGHQPGTMLFWHEGQLRALEGQNPQAIALMKQSKVPVEVDKAGWNAYVDATTAFLAHDRESLVKAKATLAATPAVDDLPVKNGKITVKLDNGQTMNMQWPPNAEIVEGFERCFDKPYKEAYFSPCRGSIK